VLEARFPGAPASAELFIAGDEGYSFTAPKRTIEDGKVIFTTEVSLPARTGTGPGLHYTLATDAGSVSGLLPYF
jgi:DsbC/DsbD-like thiol-disulfide interchange protein